MEAGKDSPPIAILSQLLDKFKKKPELSSRMPEVQNTARIRAREKKAEEIKKAAESKQGIIGTEPKATPDVIQDAYKAKLVQKGVPLSIEEKLSIIEHQIPAEKVEILKNQFDRLKEVIKQYPKVPDARIQIEDLVKNIPASVYADKDMADIAREMKQIAYNHIALHRSYLADITPQERIETGKVFRDVNPNRVNEDVRYLKQLDEGQQIFEHREIRAEVELQTAKDLVEVAKKASVYDLEGAFLTLTPHEPMDMDIALRKIDKGPEWIKKIRDTTELNPHTATTLAEMADLSLTKEASLLEDSSYLFVKGAQLSFQGTYAYVDFADGSAQPYDVENLNKITQVTAKIRDHIDGLSTKLDLEKSAVDRAFSVESRSPLETGQSAPPTPGTGPEFGQDLINIVNDMASDASFSPAEVREVRNLKALIEEYDKKVSGASPEAADEAAYELYSAVDFDKQSSWRRFMYSNDELGKKFEKIRKTAERVSNEKYHDRDMRRGWSSLYLSYELIKQSWRSAPGLISKRQDLAAREMRKGVYKGDWQEANQRSTGTLIQYVESEDYVRNRIDYLKNIKNRTEVKAYSGEDPFKLVGDKLVFNEDHKWYKEITDKHLYNEWRENLQGQIKWTNDLQQLYVAVQMNTDLDKLQGLYADFGDAGYPKILNKRNKLNMAVFQVFKDKGAHIMFDKDGNIRALDAGDLKLLEQSVIEQMTAHSELYQGAFNEWEGSFDADVDGNPVLDAEGNMIRRMLERTDIEDAVNEVSFLISVTGQRAQMFCNTETPLSMNHQLDNPSEYAAQPAEGKMIQAMAPFRWLIERWGVGNAFARLVMRKMFSAEATRTGIDAYWDKRLKGVKQGSAEFKLLAKWAFNIVVDPDDHHNHEKIAEILSVCDVHHESKGWKKWIFGDKEGAHKHHTPHSLSELSMEDLREQIIWREGMRVLDARFTGAYHIIDSGWQIGAQIDALKGFGLFTNDNGVLLHETAKLEVSAAMDVTGNKEKLKEAVKKLKEHTFVKMAKYDPISSFEALRTKLHKGTREWFEKYATKLNIFHDEAMGENPVGGAFREDTFSKSVSMRKTMIDTSLAEHRTTELGGKIKVDPKAPVDYSKWIPGTSDVLSIYSDVEVNAMEKVLRVTKVLDAEGKGDVRGFLDVMKELSTFVMKDEICEELSHPAIAVYFSTVRKIDPRIQYLDSNKLFNPNVKNWSDRVSATEGGYAAGGGFHRWAGDTANSVKALVDHLQPLLEAKDAKDFLMHLKPFISAINYSGGHKSTKAPVAQSLWLGWSAAVVRDAPADAFGLGGHNSTIPSSSAQRATGLGAPSLERTEIDHIAHDVEMAVGTVFHADMPDFTEKMEKKFGLALYIGKWRIPMIRLYNAWAFAMIGSAIMALGFYESAKKGVSDTSGGGGGGGAPHGGGHH